MGLCNFNWAQRYTMQTPVHTLVQFALSAGKFVERQRSDRPATTNSINLIIFMSISYRHAHKNAAKQAHTQTRAHAHTHTKPKLTTLPKENEYQHVIKTL